MTAAPGVRGEAGFTLVEMVVSLLLLLLALGLAAQLLGETAQMMVDVGRQSLDPAAPLVATRMRVDLQGATSVLAVLNNDGSCAYVALSGYAHPLSYEQTSAGLIRTTIDDQGNPRNELLLPTLVSFTCQVTVPGQAPQLANIGFSYTRASLRRSPLDLEVPALWRKQSRTPVAETLNVTPRGAGLGSSW